MTHFASARFWREFDRLPSEIQALARKNYELLKSNPEHPSLHFKKIEEVWSVRVGLNYRALGVDVEGGVLWFWIGTHAEYDRLVG